MKKLLLLLLISVQALGQNRLLDDRTLFIDTYTNASKKEVIYYFASQAFPTLKDSATIIIDGSKLDSLTSFKMCNGQQGDNYFPWHITTAKFIPLPGTHVRINSNVDYAFCVHGLKNLTVIGDNSTKDVTAKLYPFVPYISKLTQEWQDGQTGLYGWRSYESLQGNFGFEFINNKPRGQVMSLSVLPGGSITLSNFECKYGFCGIKVNGYTEGEVELNFSNFFIHDQIDGEGLYLGSTQQVPVTKLKGIIQNGVIARTACEGIQLQHLSGLTVKDITVFATGTAWISPFQQWQDTGIQWNCARGINKIDNVVVDGYRSVGINIFGGDGTGSNNVATNIFIYGGHGSHINMHSSCNTSSTWTFTNTKIGLSSLSYYTSTKIAQKPFLMSPLNGSDFMNGEFDIRAHEAPKYVNSGFENSDIQQWREFYAAWHQAGVKTVRPMWKSGQVVIDVNGGYGFYRCLVDHESESVSPRYSDKFVKMTWNGNDYPPDDFRMLNHNAMGAPYENRILREYYRGGKRITVTELGEFETK